MGILFLKMQSVTTAEFSWGTKPMPKTLLTLRVSRVKNIFTVDNRERGADLTVYYNLFARRYEIVLFINIEPIIYVAC